MRKTSRSAAKEQRHPCQWSMVCFCSPIWEIEHLAKEWERGKKDIREIFSVLPSAERMQKRNQKAKGPQITPMMVEFFQSYLNENTHIKKIAVLGFNTGIDPLFRFSFHFQDIQVKPSSWLEMTLKSWLLILFAIPMSAHRLSSSRKPTPNDLCWLEEPWVNQSCFWEVSSVRSVLIWCTLIVVLILVQQVRRYEWIALISFFPSQSICFSFLEEDLESSIYLAHSRTVIFMENVRPYSNTGADVFNAWDSLVTQGKLRETSGPRTWEELNRCVCEGMFVASEQIVPVSFDHFYNNYSI